MSKHETFVDLSVGSYTKEDIARLLASGDDSSDSQLKVSRTGLAYISKDTISECDDGVSVRLETWIAGNSYVGPEAAKDDAWVARVFNALRENWPNPNYKVVDIF
jgi:hypothetical protein